MGLLNLLKSPFISYLKRILMQYDTLEIPFNLKNDILHSRLILNLNVDRA